MHHILCVLHGSEVHFAFTEFVCVPRIIRHYLCGHYLSDVLHVSDCMDWCGLYWTILNNVTFNNEIHLVSLLSPQVCNLFCLPVPHCSQSAAAGRHGWSWDQARNGPTHPRGEVGWIFLSWCGGSLFPHWSASCGDSKESKTKSLLKRVQWTRQPNEWL